MSKNMAKTNSGIKISKAMNKNPVITSKNEFLPNAARKMLANNVGCLIVKEGGNLIGIITEKDIVEGAVGKELNIKKTSVKDVMTTLVVTISPDEDLLEAIDKMNREDVRRLPVIKENKLVGLLTIKDILRVDPDLLDHLRSTLLKKK